MVQLLKRLEEITEQVVGDPSRGDDISLGGNTLGELIDIINCIQKDVNPSEQKLKEYKFTYFKQLQDQCCDINALFLRFVLRQTSEKFLHGRLDLLSKHLLQLNNRECRGDLFGVYLTTNESNSRSIQQIIKQGSFKEKGCHVGFSGFHNFDIMAARQSVRGLIFDFNPWNALLLDHALSLMLRCRSRQEWLIEFSKTVKDLESCQSQRHPSYFSPNVNDEADFAWQKGCGNTIEELENEFQREGSWLSTEENYQYIKKLAEAGKIVCITEDIRNTRTFEKVACLFKEHGEPIGTLYISNICKYMETEEDKAAFKNTVKALAQTKTWVINCPRTGTGKDPIQHVCLGQEYLQNPTAPFFELG